MPNKCNNSCKTPAYPENPSQQPGCKEPQHPGCKEPQQPRCKEPQQPRCEEPQQPRRKEPQQPGCKGPQQPECNGTKSPVNPKPTPNIDCECPKKPGDGGNNDSKHPSAPGQDHKGSYNNWSVGRNNITGNNKIHTSGTDCGISM